MLLFPNKTVYPSLEIDQCREEGSSPLLFHRLKLKLKVNSLRILLDFTNISRGHKLQAHIRPAYL